MFKELKDYLSKPALYTPSTKSLWDDEHISKGLLEAHLNPHWHGATRKHEFLDKSVSWISKIVPPKKYDSLLDLGCGPGLYAERFSAIGYSVTGVDFSKRSIAYAKEQTLLHKSNIEYYYQDYMKIDFAETFDVSVMIYCDYAVLSITDRLILLNKVYRALKPGGKFIFDVFTPRMRKEASQTWGYCENGGFFCDEPYIHLKAVYQYGDDDETELRQDIIISGETVNIYNIYDHFFTKEKLVSEARTAGFKEYEFYGDVAGNEFLETGETICGVLTK